jgi:hypothetical protein
MQTSLTDELSSTRHNAWDIFLVVCRDNKDVKFITFFFQILTVINIVKYKGHKISIFTLGPYVTDET